MKQSNKTLLYLTLFFVGFAIGLYTGHWGGYKVGHIQGCIDGYNIVVSKLQVQTDSLRADYIQSRDYYDSKLDSLIEECDRQ